MIAEKETKKPQKKLRSYIQPTFFIYRYGQYADGDKITTPFGYYWTMIQPNQLAKANW